MTIFWLITVAILLLVGGLLTGIHIANRNTDNKTIFFENAKDRDGTIFMFLCFGAVLLLLYWFQEHVDEATLSFVLGNLVNGFILVGKSAIDSKLTNGNIDH